MSRERATAAIRTVLGVFVGVALYNVFIDLTGPEWTDSLDVLTEGCARQGMYTSFVISEGGLTHWECVARDETATSHQGATEESSQE